MRKAWNLLAFILLTISASFAAQPPLSVDEAQGLLDQYELQLEELEAGISAYQTELSGLAEKAKARDRKFIIKSETKGIASINRTAARGVPRLYIYNKLSFQPRKDNNSLTVGLFLQNDVGINDWDTIDQSGSSLNLNALWGAQKLNLTVGSFYTSDSPLILGRAVRAKDFWPETRHSFSGFQAAAAFPNLNLRGFFTRIKAGGGADFDRYAIFSRMETKLGGLKSDFVLLRLFDDTASAAVAAPALSSTTLSYQFDTRSLSGKRAIDVQGETNLAWVDGDSQGGPDGSLTYAARAEGQVRLKLPLRYSYYIISRDYPVTYSAVRSIEPDYCYQYEENPWLPDYISNLQRLAVETGSIVLPAGTLALNLDWAGELEPAVQSRKTFGYCGGELYRYLSGSIPYLEGARLQLKGGQYWTRRPEPEEISVRQNLAELSLTQTIGDTILIGGYQQLHLSGRLPEQVLGERIRKPFAEFHWSLGASNWTWRGEFSRGSVKKDYHRLTATFPIGSGSAVSCRFEETNGDEDKTDLLVEYRSQF